MTTFLVAACIVTAGQFAAGEAELVAEDCRFTEGPVWLSSGELLFSDIPANRIYRADKRVFREPSGQSNGLALDRAGRLLAAEHANRRVSRTEPDGSITVLAEHFEGKRFNSPNDLAVAKNGDIYFTDPPYGLQGRLESPDADMDYCGVYRISGSGKIDLLTKEIKMPNGIVLSPDEKRLYVADSQFGYIQVYELGPDGLPKNSRRFTDVPGPDGMAMDYRGNVWTTARDGVRVYSPAGELLETIAVPQKPANCTLGGPEGKTLFVTARTAVYKIALAERAVRR